MKRYTPDPDTMLSNLSSHRRVSHGLSHDERTFVLAQARDLAQTVLYSLADTVGTPAALFRARAAIARELQARGYPDRMGKPSKFFFLALFDEYPDRPAEAINAVLETWKRREDMMRDRQDVTALQILSRPGEYPAELVSDIAALTDGWLSSRMNEFLEGKLTVADLFDKNPAWFLLP